jgi:hypothetical protein
LQAFGAAENLGNPVNNPALRQELRDVFISFYDRHVNESDPGTCILKINLTFAAAFSDDAKYIIDYQAHTAEKFPFVNDIVYE